jgi:8-oxo-dGTP diphosphatase
LEIAKVLRTEDTDASHCFAFGPNQPNDVKKQTASIVLLNSADQCLLFLRDEKPGIPYPNTWDLLGGGIETRESAEEAIRREMLEELELTLTNPALFKIYELADRIEHLFWQRTDLDIRKTTLHEGQKLAWFYEEQIRSLGPEELAFGFRDILVHFYTIRPFRIGA